MYKKVLLIGFILIQQNLFALCEEDSKKFCAEVSGLREVARCLMEHKDNLSESCKQEIDRTMQMRKDSASRGGGAMSAMGGLNSMGPSLPIFSYEGRYSKGNSSTGVSENKVSVSTPVYKTDKDTWTVSANYSNLHFSDQLVLSTNYTAPKDLTRVEFGGGYHHRMEAGKSFGARVSFGYAGDRPFHSTKDANYNLMGNYLFPGSSSANGSDMWMLMLFMGNNNSIANNIPLPGFAYFYRTTNFNGVFGFPFITMQWTPVDPFTYSLSLFGLNLTLETAYGHRDVMQFFGGYAITRQSFMPHDRPTEKERLTFREQKIYAGLRLPLFNFISSEFTLGKANHRMLYLSEKSLKRDGGEVVIGDDNFFSMNIKILF